MNGNRKWIVYTESGDYRDIWARDKWEAMRKVREITLGRHEPYDAELQA